MHSIAIMSFNGFSCDNEHASFETDMLKNRALGIFSLRPSVCSLRADSTDFFSERFSSCIEAIQTSTCTKTS